MKKLIFTLALIFLFTVNVNATKISNSTASDVIENLATTDANIGAIGADTDTIIARQLTTDANLGKTDANVSAIDKIVDTMTLRQATTDANIGALGTRQATTDANIGALGTRQATTDANIGAIDANVSAIDKVVDKIEKVSGPVYNRTNYFVVEANMALATWNTVASHEIATVTGDVRMRIIIECNETLAQVDAATAIFGTENNKLGIIASTIIAGSDDANLLVINKFWHDASPATADSNGVALTTNAIKDVIILNGKDVGYTIAGAALTDGLLNFHIWWEALSDDGAVTAGAGGGL